MSVVDRLEEPLPQSERFVSPGASHILHEDNAAAHNTTVLAFLSRNADST